MIALDPQKSKLLGNGVVNASDSAKKFMPKKPVINDIGMNIRVTIVRIFMMSFVRLAITDKYVSRVPEIRSRRLSEMS